MPKSQCLLIVHKIVPVLVGGDPKRSSAGPSEVAPLQQTAPFLQVTQLGPKDAQQANYPGFRND